MKLRPYQEQAITESRQAFAQGNKEVILMLPTGAGKSIVIKSIIEMAKGKVLFVVHRKILLGQMKETLRGLDVEISTLQKMGKQQTDMYDLVIHDECHYGWGSKLKNNLNFKFYLGLSATPYDSKGYPLKCDKLIHFMQMPDLIELGYAVPFKVLGKTKVSTKNLKTTGGDFNNKDSFALMDKTEITKDILKVYKQYCNDKKTILYAVNIQHAESLKNEFENDGIHCEVIHSKKKCDEIVADFKNNKVKLLINVSILTIGFDDGDVEALLLASPTKSIILAQQIYGRASRLPIKTNKKQALIIDCADVIYNTMHPMDRYDFNKTSDDKGAKKCPTCSLLLKLTNRSVVPLNDYEYKVISDYKCECGYEERIENIKVLEGGRQCQDCYASLTGTPIDMQTNDKNIEFVQICSCGCKNVYREILLNDSEMQEIRHDKAMKGCTMDDVKIIIKAEVKRCGYHWRYADRLIEHFEMKRYEPKFIIDQVKICKSKGQKISRLMYI